MEPDDDLAREMALFRVQAAVESRAEIMQFAEIFGAKIVDVSRRSLTIEVTGVAGEDRLLRAHDPPPRPDRDGAHRRGRDRQSRPEQLSRGAPRSRRRPPSTSLEDVCWPSAERARRLLVSVTVPRSSCDDPSAAVFASRLADDRWFCWEQPDRDGFALAGARQRARGRLARPRALRRSGRRVRRDHPRAAARRARRPAGRRRPGLGCGGFAFAPDGGRRRSGPRSRRRCWCCRSWRCCAIGGETWLTLCALVRRRASIRRSGSRRGSSGRLAALARGGCRSLDPHRTGEARIASVAAPGALRGSGRARRSSGSAPASSRRWCSRARWRSRRPAPTTRRRSSAPCASCSRPASASASARPRGPSSAPARSCSCAAAAPGAATVALAGSTRRSADPAVDDHLGEQLLRSAKDRREHEIVARRIERALAPRSVWVEAEAEPALVKVANIQHLATPIHAQLAEPLSAIELAGAAASDAGGRRRARCRGARRDRRARADGPRLVRRARSAGWTRPRTASSASPCARRCCATAPRTFRRRRDRRRLRPRRRARRDRAQARGAAAAARRIDVQALPVAIVQRLERVDSFWGHATACRKEGTDDRSDSRTTCASTRSPTWRCSSSSAGPRWRLPGKGSRDLERHRQAGGEVEEHREEGSEVEEHRQPGGEDEEAGRRRGRGREARRGRGRHREARPTAR